MRGNLLNEEKISSIIKNILPKLKTYMAAFRKNTPRFQTTAQIEKAAYGNHVGDEYIQMYMNEYRRIFSEFLKESLDPSFDRSALEKIQCSESYEDRIKREIKAERARERLKNPKKRAEKNAKQREWYRKRFEDPQKRKEENARQREWYKKRFENLQKREERNAKRRERKKNKKKLKDEQKNSVLENAKVVFPEMLIHVNTIETATDSSSLINEPMSGQMEDLKNLYEKNILDDLENPLNRSKVIRSIDDDNLNYLQDQLKNTTNDGENKLVEKKDDTLSNEKRDLLKEALEESEIDLETNNLIEGYLDFFKQTGDDLGRLLDKLEHESEDQKTLELIEKDHPETSAKKISKQLQEMIKKGPNLINQENQRELRSLKKDFKDLNN